MHYHCEIVIPPTDRVEDAIGSVMKKFSENGEDEDGYGKHAFWDWYVIGGRYAGQKMTAQFSEEQIEAFHKWCVEEGVTVSSFTAGKQELQPASQIPKVDAKWNEMFPSEKFVSCPLFNHSNDQYGRDGIRSSTMDGDVCTLANMPAALKCHRVIIAGPSYVHDDSGWTGPLEAHFMLAEDAWNGCNHMPVAWDGSVVAALSAYKEKLQQSAEAYAAAMTPQCDWLVVTVDYHS